MTATDTVPQTADELEELLNDGPRFEKSLQDGSFPGFVKGYVDKFKAKNEDLVAQFREQAQLGWQQYLQEQADQGFRPAAGFRPGAGPALKGRAGRAERAIRNSGLGRAEAQRQAEKQLLFAENSAGAKLDDTDEAASFGKFFHAAFLAEHFMKERGDSDGIDRIRSWKKQVHNALTERVGSEGGYLIPEVLRSEVLMVAIEEAVVRSRARVIPMDSLSVPLPAIDDISHQNNVYGGVQGFWTEEGASLSASAPTFNVVRLLAKKLTAYTSIPNELLQDSVTPLDTWFGMFFPKALAWFEDVAFLTGTGVGEPQGILTAPGNVRVPVAADNTIVFADIAKAYSRMWPASLKNAIWLCSPDVLLQLLQLAASPGGTAIAPPGWLQGYQAIGVPGGGDGDGVNYLLMGRPLVVTEKMPSCTSGNTTTPGALTFVDLSYYLLGDRQSMQIAASDEYLFGQDMMAYRVIERLDGRFWLQSAITPQNGSTSTLSPLVKIDTTQTS